MHRVIAHRNILTRISNIDKLNMRRYIPFLMVPLNSLFNNNEWLSQVCTTSCPKYTLPLPSKMNLTWGQLDLASWSSILEIFNPYQDLSTHRHRVFSWNIGVQSKSSPHGCDGLFWGMSERRLRPNTRRNGNYIVMYSEGNTFSELANKTGFSKESSSTVGL